MFQCNFVHRTICYTKFYMIFYMKFFIFHISKQIKMPQYQIQNFEYFMSKNNLKFSEECMD